MKVSVIEVLVLCENLVEKYWKKSLILEGDVQPRYLSDLSQDVYQDEIKTPGSGSTILVYQPFTSLIPSITLDYPCVSFMHKYSVDDPLREKTMTLVSLLILFYLCSLKTYW